MEIQNDSEVAQHKMSRENLEGDYTLLAANVKDFGMFIADVHGRITSWNAGAERLFGWTEDEAVGQPSSLIFTAEDRAADAPGHELRTAAAEGRAEDVRWHLRKDGTQLFVDGVMTGLRDQTGRLRGFGKVVRDVTERKHREDQIQEALVRERTIARVLQRPLTLAPDSDAFPGIAIATHYEPASDEADCGGDFFDVFALPSGRICLAVADASGKGIYAAARAIQVKEVLRAFTREYPHSPAHIASRVNDYLYGSQRLDPVDDPNERFVTLVLAIFDPETGEASVVSAAGEPPLLIRASGAVEVIEALPGVAGLPLGVQSGEMYHAVPLQLRHGDTLLMVTDGLTEARRGKYIFLGSEGLAELAKAALSSARPSDGGAGSSGAHSQIGEAAVSIVEVARQFANGNFRDDVCLLLACRR